MNLSKEQKKSLENTAKNFNLSLVLLFGSQAKGRTRSNSDFDIAIKFKDKKAADHEDILGLVGEMTGIFKGNVDISIINNANPLLLRQINKDNILLYGPKKEYIEFGLHAFNRYADYRPFLRMEREFVKAQIHKLKN